MRFPLEVFDRDARGVAGGPADDRADLRHRLGGRRDHRGGLGADRPGLRGSGADIIDVSTGQVDAGEQPAFGRSYQTPYADRIRNEAGLATMAVGVISSWDDVNSILLAGRADLCLLGRAHLYDPNWTLHAAAEQEYNGQGAPWPDPWQAGDAAAADRPDRRREAAAGADPGRPDPDRPRPLAPGGPGRARLSTRLRRADMRVRPG